MNIVRVDPERPDLAIVARAGELLRNGGLVAFPTETVYGLGANAWDDAAVRRVFTAKGRSPDDPLIVHLATIDQLDAVALSVPGPARALAERFWPGPLTLVVPKRPTVPDSATAGLATVGVRVPSHPVALALLRAAGVPAVAPSANLFTRTSPTLASHVADDLGDRVDLILDAGPTQMGIESTVVDVSTSPPRLLRPGATTAEQIEDVLADLSPPVGLAIGATGVAASPGLMKKHYAPRARVLFFSGPTAAAVAAMRRAADEELGRGRRVGLLVCAEDAAHFRALGERAVIEELGACDDLSAIAQRLYAGMRQLDGAGVDSICVRDFGRAGLGLAILDRLTRAANQQVIHV